MLNRACRVNLRENDGLHRRIARHGEPWTWNENTFKSSQDCRSNNKRKTGTEGSDPNFSAAKLGERPVCPHISPYFRPHISVYPRISPIFPYFPYFPKWLTRPTLSVPSKRAVASRKRKRYYRLLLRQWPVSRRTYDQE